VPFPAFTRMIRWAWEGRVTEMSPVSHFMSSPSNTGLHSLLKALLLLSRVGRGNVLTTVVCLFVNNVIQKVIGRFS